MAELLPVKGSSRMPGFRGNLAGNSAAGRNGMSARGMQVSSDSVSVTDTSLEAALTPELPAMDTRGRQRMIPSWPRIRPPLPLFARGSTA